MQDRQDKTTTILTPFVHILLPSRAMVGGDCLIIDDFTIMTLTELTLLVVFFGGGGGAVHD